MFRFYLRCQPRPKFEFILKQRFIRKACVLTPTIVELLEYLLLLIRHRLSKSSLFRLKYSNSWFISGVLCLLFSGSMTLLRHSFYIIFFINHTSCQHTTIPQMVAGVQTFFKMKIIFSFGVIFDFREANIEPWHMTTCKAKHHGFFFRGVLPLGLLIRLLLFYR